jgi:hypothetical protein
MENINDLGKLVSFKGKSLTNKISNLEDMLVGRILSEIPNIVSINDFSSTYKAAQNIKLLVGEINTIIHVTGIISSLAHILENNETIESVSLGAGNAHSDFDLETNYRVAEFKFISWQGGPESIRQNTLFVDFYKLAEKETEKHKCIYLLDTIHPIKFLSGTRSIKSVLSKNRSVSDDFMKKYPNICTVNEYYRLKIDEVQLINISEYFV